MSVYFGLTTPFQYRLVGPGAWHGARDAILSSRERMMQPFNTRRPPRLDMATVGMETTSGSRTRRLLLPAALVVGAIAAAAWALYQHHDEWY